MNRSFIWQDEPTPEWFSSDYSYRMNADTKEIEVPTMDGNVIVGPGTRITEGKGGFFTVDGESEQQVAPKLNREQRRESMKHDERYTVSRIIVEFDNGKALELDVDKVMIIDKHTKAQLFDYVMEQK